jgi:PAS domain S-box-containing protein
MVLPMAPDHALVIATSRPSTEEERAFALALAGRTRSALVRVRLFDEVQAAERALRAQTGLLEAVANGTTDLIYAKGLDSRFVMLNDATAQVLGTTVGEALGKEETDFLRDDSVHDALESERRIVASGDAEHRERRLATPQGERVFTVNQAPLRDDDGRVIGIVTVAHDVTERTRVASQREAAFARERETRRRIELLQTVTARFAEAATPAEIAGAIVRETPPALDADTTLVLLEDDGDLKHVAASGYRAEILERLLCIPRDAAMPSAKAHRTGETVVVESQQEALSEFPGLEAVRGAWSSAVFVPICHERVSLGVVAWGFARARSFDADFLRLADAIVSQAALALERAHLFEAEQRIALGLQRSLLPSRLPQAAGARVTVRYQAGAEQLEVGGDWYEVIALPTGRVGLVVGDVVGRGVRAAAAMGQLRSAVAALSLVTKGPGDLLERLETFASQTDGAEFATVVFAVLDPVTGLLRYSCAAHPPPLVVYPDGQTAFLEEGRSPPLCSVGGEHRPEAAIRIPPGSTLVLYTDGLVERRGASLDAGLDRLRAVASTHARLAIEQFGDAVLEEMTGDQHVSDDIAMLVTRTADVPASALSLRVPGTPDQIRVLRQELREWLRQRDVPREPEEELVLAAGEAVANAVEHAYAGRASGPVVLTAWSADGDSTVCVEVSDKGGWRRPGNDVDRGRGLEIMRVLLDAVEVVQTPEGTSISMTKRVRPREAGVH